MRRGRQEARELDDRPHDWDREGRSGGGDSDRGRRDDRPRDRGSDERCDRPQDRGPKPGPDGEPRPEYHGPHTTEEYLVREWQQSYEQACSELRVEVLKETIRKSWGKSLETIAKELDNLMCKDWELSQEDGDHAAEREKLVKNFAKFVLEEYNKDPKEKKR